jgi:hypothetical protein
MMMVHLDIYTIHVDEIAEKAPKKKQQFQGTYNNEWVALIRTSPTVLSI